MPFWPRSETKSGQLCNAKPVGNRELFEVYQPVQWACSQEVLCISMYTYTHNCCLIVGLLVQVSTKWKMCACVPVPCRIHLFLAVPQAFLSRWCQETTSDSIWSWRSRTWLDHHPILGGYKPSKIIEKKQKTHSQVTDICQLEITYDHLRKKVKIIKIIKIIKMTQRLDLDHLLTFKPPIVRPAHLKVISWESNRFSSVFLPQGLTPE